MVLPAKKKKTPLLGWKLSSHGCQAIDGELGGLEERTLILQFTEAPRQRIQAQVNNERRPGGLVVVAIGGGEDL